MFASENLFKSIPCPYFSQATNTCTCERPYCPFKHSVQYETVSGSAQATTSSQLAEDKSIANKEVKSSNESVEAVSKQQQPTNALENLSNALQTIQDLIKTAPNLVAAASSGATDLPNADILSKLSNLFQSASQTNSVASGGSTSTTTTTEVKKSESKSLKRQQSVPDYTPTPINELKKLKHKDLENDEDESSQPKRRIKNEMISSQMQSSKSEEVLTTRKKFDSGEVEGEKPKRLKSDADNEEKTEKKGESSDNEAKKRSYDLVTFSKLTLNQQMLKRYELLNKPIPTPSQLAEAKLKKKLGEKDAKKQVGDKNANLNTPQLILDDNTSQKVPLALRSRHLKVIFDNTRPLYADLKEAAQKSSESEKSIYDRAKNKMIYANLIAILIKNLRSQLVEKQQQTNNSSPTNQQQQSMYKYNKPGVNISPQPSTSFSYEMMLSGPKAVNYTIGRSKPIEIKDLSVTQLYELFYSYILNDKQLTDNSFPRWMTSSSLEDAAEKRLAYIPNFSKGSNQTTTTTTKKSLSTVTVSGETIVKNCKRCKSTFHLISSDGRTKRYATSNSECVYHWGKLRSIWIDKSVEKRYSCCSGGLTSEGCEIGKHVYDGDYDGHGTGQNISDYVETREASTSEQLLNAKTSKNIYALDCEMCYTAHGLELARVSIVDVEMRDVYEALVRPEAEVLDYNTRWSGLTAQTYVDADSDKHAAAASGKVKTLREVQADLVRLFNKDTILIGHSLESDFKALKLVHSCVVDTSVVFPHKAGPPLKRALRNLMSEYLQKIIQEDVDGHDSKEDATSCIQLMLWKIEEDLKSKKKQAIFASSSQPSTSSSSAAATMTKTTSLNLNINQKPAPSIPTSSQQHPPQKLNNVYKLNNLNSNNKTLSVTPTKKSPSNTNIPPAQRKSNEFNVDKDKYKYTKINNNNNNNSANAKNPTTQGNNGNSSSSSNNQNQKQKIKI